MERQLVFGQSWSEVMTFCYRLALTFGRNIPQAQVDNVNVTWEDPNVRNELTEAQTATIHKGLNVPDDVLWLRIGYTRNRLPPSNGNSNSTKQRRSPPLRDNSGTHSRRHRHREQTMAGTSNTAERRQQGNAKKTITTGK